MTKVCDFIAGLARSHESDVERKTTVDTVYKEQALGITSIYYIIKTVKASKTTGEKRSLSAKKTQKPADVVVAVNGDIKEDQCVAFVMPNILPDEVSPAKKSVFGRLSSSSSNSKLIRYFKNVSQENNSSRKINGNSHVHCLASTDHVFGCAQIFLVHSIQVHPSVGLLHSRLSLKWLGRGG
jgi:hypothetical protein